MHDTQSILITGASRGLGQALAIRLAKPGRILGLMSRNQSDLAQTARRVQEAGASAHLLPADVTHRPTMERQIERFMRDSGRIDLIIANAGLAGWPTIYPDQTSKIQEIFDVNVTGLLNTIAPFIPHMVEARHGRIVGISSIAAFRSLPKGAYPASKMAVRYLLESWRSELKQYSIDVSIVYPGFIDTDMTDSRTYRYPFLVSADSAARAIVQGLEKNQQQIIFPWQWRVLLPVLRLLPIDFFRR